jgi:hypothetical protein
MPEKNQRPYLPSLELNIVLRRLDNFFEATNGLSELDRRAVFERVRLRLHEYMSAPAGPVTDSKIRQKLLRIAEICEAERGAIKDSTAVGSHQSTICPNP